jgi:response regulator RpfG family c-di-GMP phosphodiesterase
VSQQEQESILVVDDEPHVVDILAKHFRVEGYAASTARNAKEALEKIQQEEYSVLLSDIRMPGMSGLDLLKEVQSVAPDMAVVMVTAVLDRETAVEALRIGAYDYVVKPFDLDDVTQSVKRALEKRRLVLENRDYQLNLEKKVRERTRELARKSREIRDLSLNAIKALVFALEAKHKYTEGHSRRVATHAAGIATEMGLSQDEIDQIELAGLLHDIGKIGIRDSILNKAGPLTEEEFEHVKTHPLVAERILQPIDELKDIVKYVKHEHERWDGSGYPDGLEGDKIPLGARIIAAADVFDALTSARAYRGAYRINPALEMMRGGRGSHFDPEVLDAFLNMIREEVKLG